MPRIEEVKVSVGADPCSKVWCMTPQLLQRAENELNEVPERRAKEIQALRELVQAVPNLKAQLDDDFLLRFLRARKFNRDRAFKMIIKYYKIRSSNQAMFGNLLPSECKDILDANIISGLPYRDDQGRTIALFRCDRWNPAKYSLEAVVRSILLGIETRLQDETVQIAGFVAIVDLEAFNWRYMQHIRPGVVSKLVSVVQDALPGRFKGFHIVRESVLVDIAYTIFKPLISSKMKKRIHFHGYDMESLYRHISPEYLPSEYGGLRGPIDYSYWPKWMHENEEFCRRLLPYGFPNI